MLRRLRCPRGHSWEAEVLSPAVGETTHVLPVCPVCGEIGEPEQELLRAKIENAPTSQIEDRDPDVETTTVALLPDQPMPAIAGYELLQEIGRGGMGIVYKAFDVRRQTIVAVKLLPRLEPAAVLRFKQEFRALADLQHPNLAAVYELGTADGYFFLVMEHVAGQPFTEHFLAIRDPADRLDQLRPAVGQLISGLQHLHNNGLLHCDVKPGNVLVTPEGRVVLLDFGLVTALDLRHRSAGDLVGSIGYIAPERYQGKAASHASDWYALGVMLFEILTGRRPFAGERTRLIWQHQYFDPPAPSEFAKDVPDVWNDLCHALLQRDPAMRPDGLEILRRLNLPTLPGSSLSRDPPLLGRDTQLAALRTAFEQVLRGRTVVVHVQGESGMGKTALVERFLDRTQRVEPIWLLRSRCHEHESVPFKGVDELVDAAAQLLTSHSEEDLEPLLPVEMATLARAFPVLRRVKLVGRGWKTSDITNPVELRRRVANALGDLLSRFAAQRPVIAFVDDFQWGDLDSAHLLVDVLAAPQPPAMLLILGSRTEEQPTPSLQYFSEHAPSESERVSIATLALAPLSLMEGGSLAQTLLADVPVLGEEWSARIADQAHGWPVHIHQLCRYLCQADHRRTLGESSHDLSLRRVIEDRLNELSAKQRQLLEILAIAGQPMPAHVAIHAAQLSPSDRSIFVPLRRDYWIQSLSDGAIECAHATVRETILAILPGGRVAECHERLARAYAADKAAEPELLAAHLLAAGRGDEAVDLYEQAAERAEEKLAFHRAAFLLRMSLDLKQRTPDETNAVLLRLAQALVNAGHGAEAATVYLRASTHADRARALQLRRLAAYHYCTSGHMHEGMSLLREVLMNAGIPIPGSPDRMRAGLAWERLRQRWRGFRFQEKLLGQITAEDIERTESCWSATASMSLFDIVAGAYYQCLHLRHALALGEPARVARALAWEAGHLSTEGPAHFAKAERLLKDAHALARRVDQAPLHALLLLIEGIMAHSRGEWPLARERLAAADELLRTRCLGVAWDRATTHAFLFWTLYQLGAFADIKSLAERFMREARERGDRFAATNFATFALPLCRAVEDKPGEARRLVRSHLEDWTQPGFHLQHLTALWSDCRTDLYDGRADEALGRLTEAWPRMRKAEMFRVQTIRITLLVLKATLLSASSPNPRRLSSLQECERELFGERLPWAEAHGYAVRAARTSMEADTPAAGAALAAALARFAELGMAAHAACARWRLGQLTDAPALTSEAEEWFRTAGIVHPLRFCRMQLGAVVPP